MIVCPIRRGAVLIGACAPITTPVPCEIPLPHLSLFPNISFGLMIDENLDCAVVHRHLTSRSEWDNRLEHNRHNWVLSAELCAISLEMCLFILVLFCFLSVLVSPFVYLSTLWHWLILKGVTEMARPMLDQSSTQKKLLHSTEYINKKKNTYTEKE